MPDLNFVGYISGKTFKFEIITPLNYLIFTTRIKTTRSNFFPSVRATVSLNCLLINIDERPLMNAVLITNYTNT